MREQRPAAPLDGASRRRLLAAGALGALGLPLLAACTDLGADATGAHTDLGLALETPEENGLPTLSAPEEQQRIGTPRGHLGLLGSALQDGFGAEELAQLLGLHGDDDAGASAPEGETFLIARLSLEGEPWTLTGLPGTLGEGLGTTGFEYRVVVQRAEGPVSFALREDDLEAPFLVRIPADPAPEDAVVEVSGADRAQRLSLVDGTVVHTDVPHLARRTVVGSTAELEDGPAGDRESSTHLDDDDGTSDALLIFADSAWTTPYASAHGWAGEDAQFLVVSARVEQRLIVSERRSVIYLPPVLSHAELVTSEGDTLEPVALELAHRGRGTGRRYAGDDTWTAWFRVPVDLDSAQVQLVVAPYPRRPELTEELDGVVGDGLAITLVPEEQP